MSTHTPGLTARDTPGPWTIIDAIEDACLIVRSVNIAPKLAEALRAIAETKTQHLRSNEMQDALNGLKAIARAALQEWDNALVARKRY